MNAVSSIQHPTEAALAEFLRSIVAESVSAAYQFIAAHGVESLPETGNFVAIIASPGDFEEYIDNAKTRVEFRIATQVADVQNREARAALHEQAIAEIQNALSWQNFDEALSTLNSQQTIINGITIGFSGWEQQGSQTPGSTDAQIVETLPYEFDVFIAGAES